jgi:hypothetical protein
MPCRVVPYTAFRVIIGRACAGPTPPNNRTRVHAKARPLTCDLQQVAIRAHRSVCVARSGHMRKYLLTYGDDELAEAKRQCKRAEKILEMCRPGESYIYKG